MAHSASGRRWRRCFLRRTISDVGSTRRATCSTSCPSRSRPRLARICARSGWRPTGRPPRRRSRSSRRSTRRSTTGLSPACSRTARRCSPSLPSRPSTGTTCARRTQSRACSPPSVTALCGPRVLCPGERQADGLQADHGRRQDLAPAERREPVAEGDRWRHLQRRHRVRHSQGQERRLIRPSPKSLHSSDIVHLIVDAVALMDLSGFEATCKVGKAGQAPFSARVLLALLIYAYSHGIRSSRAIERLCGRDVGYRFIVGAAVPDHSVIARFRQRHAERMKAVFLAVLELCRAAGLIRLGLVALDGTKVKANAALDANRTASSIEAEIARMLAEAEAVDAREDRQFQDQRGDALPEGLTKAADRQARRMACKAKLEKRTAEAVARQHAKIDARRAEEQATGKRRRGRKPKAP